MKCLVYILVLAWVQLSPVLAQSSAADQSAQLGYSQRLYDNGHYLSAANAARELGTASAHAFAARSVLSHVVSRDLDASAALFIAEGEADARYALVLDPDCVEARVQCGLARYLAGDVSGARDTWRHCLAERPDLERINAYLAMAERIPE